MTMPDPLESSSSPARAAITGLLPLVERLAGLRVMVIGDVILDEYLIGRAERLSREAPIPVLEFIRRELIPGGATNPSTVITSLGSHAQQIGVIGPDSNGALLQGLLHDRAIQADGLVRDMTRPTTTKTRIMALTGLRFPQQVARLDHLDRRPISAAVEAQIIAEIERRTDVQALLVSDYLTGLVTAPIAQAVVRHARALGIVALADAQGQLDKYQGFDLIKCNADEAARFLQRELSTDAAFEAAADSIFAVVQGVHTLLITRGAGGVTLAQRDHVAQHLPAPHIEDVFDTVGAGDTVVALMALALAAGIPPAAAAQLANLAAGIVIRKVGNYAPSPAELREAIREQSEAIHTDQV